MTPSERILPAPALENWAADILKAAGFTDEESRITARSLVLSDLMGHPSHGVIRVTRYAFFLRNGDFKSGVDLDVLNETHSSLLVDAQCGLGQVQMPRLLDLLLEKAKTSGTVTGAMRNCGHAGRIGEWSEYIAKAGFAGFVFVNDNGVERGVAPPGGKQGVTSTNPVAFGLPLPDHDYFSVDFSTSATAFGKTRIAYLAGEHMPEGMLQDFEGNPATDPAVIWEAPEGAILPMGGAQGYKGFALSMMVDCLTAGLSGGFTPPAPDGAPYVNNVLVTVWNPETFDGLAHMREQARQYIDFVKSSEPIDPARPIRIPGERSKAEKEKREREGIPLSQGAYEAIAKLSEKLGVTVPKPE